MRGLFCVLIYSNLHLTKAMLLKDFLQWSVLRWTNQRLPSNLLGTIWLTNYINYALSDIYTFEWKFWTFMYDKVELDCVTSFTEADEVVYVDVPYPLLRVLYIEDLSNGSNAYTTMTERESFLVQNFECLNIEPTDKIDPGHIYYKMHNKRIYLKNNKNKYRIHYVHYYDRVDYSETALIPIPDIFIWALYSLTMGYVYPNYGQQGDNKEANAWAKWRQQLGDLAKMDSMQMAWIYWRNIQ